jgi:hypothetical protein
LASLLMMMSVVLLEEQIVPSTSSTGAHSPLFIFSFSPASSRYPFDSIFLSLLSL